LQLSLSSYIDLILGNFGQKWREWRHKIDNLGAIWLDLARLAP